MPAADDRSGSAGKGARRRRRKPPPRKPPPYKPPTRPADVKSDREMRPGRRAAAKRAAPKPYPLLRQGRPGNRVFEGPRTRAREDVYRRQQGRRDNPTVERLRKARTQDEKRDVLIELIRPHVREGRTQSRSGYAQLLARLNQRDRSTVRKAAQREQRATRSLEQRADRVDPNWRNRQARVGRGKPDVEVAGIPIEAALEHVTSGAQGQAAARLARGGYDAARILPTLTVNLGRAFVENPGATTKSSIRTAKEAVTGIPQAAKMLVNDPGKVAETTVADYKRRYGMLLSDPAKFRRAVQSEYGVTPFALDIGAAATPGGYAAGAVVRTAPVLRALGAGERRGGRIGSASGTVRRAATENRPNLRFSAGEGGVVRQRRAGNLFRGVTQELVDTRRRGKADEKLRERGWATDGGGRVLRNEDGTPQRLGEATPKRRSAMLDALKPGEVPAFYSLRENKVTGKLTGRRMRAVGAVKGRSRLWMLSHRGRVLKEVDNQLARLDGDEAKALHSVVALGLPAAVGEGKAAAIRALEKRRDDIIAERAATDLEDVDAVLEESNDNLATINEILDDPERYLTPNVRETATELIKIQRREDANDAGLYAATAIAGRIGAQAQHLGIDRAGDPARYAAMLASLDAEAAGRGVERSVSYEEIGTEIAQAHPDERKKVARQVQRREEKAARAAERALVTAKLDAARIKSTVAERERGRVKVADVPDTIARLEKYVAEMRKQGWSSHPRVIELEARMERLRNLKADEGGAGRPLRTAELRSARQRADKAEADEAVALKALRRAEVKAARQSGVAAGALKKAEDREVARVVKEINDQLRAKERELTRVEAQMSAARGSLDDIKPGRVARVDAQREKRLADQAARVEVLRREMAELRDRRAERVRITRAALADEGDRIATLTGRYRTPDERRRIALDADVRVAARRYENARAETKKAREEFRVQALRTERVSVAMRARAAEVEEALKAARELRDLARERAQAAKKIANRTGEPDFPRDFEDISDWQARVEAAARDAGLEEPGYWASTPRPVDEMSLRTVGGARLTGKVKERTGSLFARGMETEGPEVFRQGIEKSIKRRFTWNLVGKNIETHAFTWSLNNGKGLTGKQMKDHIDREGFDPDEMVFINTGGSWKTLREDPESADLDDLDPDDSTDLSTILDDASTSYATIKSEAVIEQRGREGFTGQAQNRYYAIPRDVGEALKGAARMDGTTSRVLELVLRQKPARIMLGLANTGWLSFQIMSNGLLAGIASTGRIFSPKHWHDTRKLWKSMDPEAREQLEMYLGIGHFHKYEQRRLGGVKGETGKYVAAWRGFRQTKVMRALHKANPIDLMFKADEAQNNLFRKLVFTSEAKRAAYRDMGRNWKGMARSQDTLLRAFEKADTPEEHMAVLTRHAAEVESHAKKVNDFLGNYVTYSPAERQMLARTVMFYGYLRFSLRFTFYTMPAEHPVMTTIGATLGQLGADEVKRLMGIGEGLPPELAAAMRRRESLPLRVMANIWLGDREDVKEGRAMTMALSRMNPLLNQVLSMEKPSQAFGLFSPVMQAAINQMLEEETFTGKPWRINPREDISVGKSPPKDPSPSYYGSILNLLDPLEYAQAAVPGGQRGAQRNRILMRDLLGLAAPFRAAEHFTLRGSQADTSLPWDPIPMRYRDPDTRKKLKKSERLDKEMRGSVGMQIGRELLPVLPKRDVYADIRERELEKLGEEAVQRKDAYRTTPKRRKRKGGGKEPKFGSGSFGGGGGGSGFGSGNWKP